MLDIKLQRKQISLDLYAKHADIYSSTFFLYIASFTVRSEVSYAHFTITS